MEPQIMSPNPYLVTSTLFFLVPAALAVQMGLMAPAIIFSCLVVASISYHTTKDSTLFWIDQVACAAAIGGLGYLAWITGPIGYVIGVLTAGACGLLYYYGWYTTSLVWSPEFWPATRAHILMHTIATVGTVAALLAFKEKTNTPIAQ